LADKLDEIVNIFKLQNRTEKLENRVTNF